MKYNTLYQVRKELLQMKDISREFSAFHMPRWAELPEIDLYMDQVVGFIDSKLAIFAESEEGNIITPTMINNYVKQKLVTPPVMKKYGKSKLAFFLLVAIIKRVLSMNEIAAMRDIALTIDDERGNIYDMMCEELEAALKYTFRQKGETAEPLPEIDPERENYYELLTVRALALAFANKLYAQKMIESRTTPKE